MDAPIIAAIQNPKLGRSSEIITAMTAVNKGNSPITTLPCEAGAVCMASAVNTGKPVITPTAVSNRSFT